MKNADPLAAAARLIGDDDLLTRLTLDRALAKIGEPAEANLSLILPRDLDTLVHHFETRKIPHTRFTLVGDRGAGRIRVDAVLASVGDPVVTRRRMRGRFPAGFFHRDANGWQHIRTTGIEPLPGARLDRALLVRAAGSLRGVQGDDLRADDPTLEWDELDALAEKLNQRYAQRSLIVVLRAVVARKRAAGRDRSSTRILGEHLSGWLGEIDRASRIRSTDICEADRVIRDPELLTHIAFPYVWSHQLVAGVFDFTFAVAPDDRYTATTWGGLAAVLPAASGWSAAIIDGATVALACETARQNGRDEAWTVRGPVIEFADPATGAPLRTEPFTVDRVIDLITANLRGAGIDVFTLRYRKPWEALTGMATQSIHLYRRRIRWEWEPEWEPLSPPPGKHLKSDEKEPPYR